jgi:hypothetical protein
VDQDRPLAIVDIDGVVADVRHRLHHIEGRHKSWQRFFDAAGDDGLHEEGRAVVERLREDHEVVYLTGRPRWLEAVTEAWLDGHGLGGHRLVMRGDDDRRPAATLKLEALGELAAGGTVGIVVDDDHRVIDAMTAAGFPTFHADWERRALDEQRALSRAQDDEGRT